MSTTTIAITSIGLFLLAALAEIGGGYLVWLWIRQKKRLIFGIVGGIILFTYGIIPTLQPSNFGRVYAAYGGFFIISSILWGTMVDKKRPDKFEIIGSMVAVLGAAIIFYGPR
ncbi:MAG: YnfA family protein [Thaumarchaeota archaeon]|nr:MAG: YnfA family protein [Nitrososphaerota archaeon]TLX89974.1 MAG: YnfA family protein [Nitrososphaerota archaeon]